MNDLGFPILSLVTWLPMVGCLVIMSVRGDEATVASNARWTALWTSLLVLALSLVLVFAVTRVILIPQGEFVTYGALTYATLSAGHVPGTARLAVAMGVVAFGLDLFAGRRALHPSMVARASRRGYADAER